MAWTVAGEEDQSKGFNMHPKISLTVNILASGCKKSEGRGDRFGSVGEKEGHGRLLT